MLLLLGLLIFLLPFFLSSANSAEPYPLWSSAYLLTLLAFSALWVLRRGLPFKNLRSLRYPLLLTLLFWMLAAILGAGRAGSPEETGKYFIGLLLFVISASLSQEEKNRLAPEIVLGAFCISLIAIFQYFFGFHLLTNYVREAKIGDPFILEKIAQQRVFFPFPTPAILGGYLAMVLPLAFCSKRRILFVIPLTVALLLTKSLGALLSLAIALTVFLTLHNYSEKKKALVLLVLGVILGYVFTVRANNLGRHLLPLFSIEARFGYWKDAWAVIRTRPWTGVGLGIFDLPGSRYAHNIFMQLWAEAGIAGALSFFWLIAAILRNGWKNLRGAAGKEQQIGLFAGSCVFLIHNLVDFTFFLPATSFIWWTMMGLLFSPDPQNQCAKKPSQSNPSLQSSPL